MRRGQTMLEYVLVLAALLAVTAVTGLLLRASQKSAVRTERLVRSNYP